MSSSSTEKKAPNTPRSTAKAAMAFYDTEQTNDSMPKPSQDVIDKAKASTIVDQVFNEATLEEGYKRKLERAFDNPPDLKRKNYYKREKVYKIWKKWKQLYPWQTKEKKCHA